MAEFIIGMNMGIYLPLILLVFAIQLIVCRKILFAWFDPITMYLVTSSFGIAFAIYLWIDKEINLDDFISFILSTSCFYIGMNIGNNQSKTKRGSTNYNFRENYINTKSNKPTQKYSNHLYVFLFVSLVILILTNLALIAIFGTLPLFATDADAAKVAARGPGLGIIFRINSALLPISLAIIFSKLFHPITDLRKNESLILYISFSVLLVLIISGGNKSSIIPIVGILSYLFLVNIRLKSSKAKIISKIIFILLGIGIIPLFIVLSKASVAGNTENAFDGLLIRLVASGEPFYYFYKYNLVQKMSSTPLDYIINSLSPFLSMLKMDGLLSILGINPPQDALGSRMITEAIGLDVGKFGTNPQYQVEGAIYFGTIGSFLYSFLVGYTIIRIRRFLLEKVVMDTSQTNLVIYSVTSLQLLDLSVDSSSLYGTIYSIIIIAVPIFLLISIILGTQLSRTQE